MIYLLATIVLKCMHISWFFDYLMLSSTEDRYYEDICLIVFTWFDNYGFRII